MGAIQDTPVGSIFDGLVPWHTHDANLSTAEKIRRAPKTVEYSRNHHIDRVGVGVNVARVSKISITVITWNSRAVT